MNIDALSSQQIADAAQRYRHNELKSRMTGFMLATLLGPVGLLYSDWRIALALSALAFLGLSSLILPLGCWIGAILMSVDAVNQHNAKVEAKAALLVLLSEAKKEEEEKEKPAMQRVSD